MAQSTYREFPPEEALMSVLRNSPEAGYLYITLHRLCGKGPYAFNKAVVSAIFHISQTLFRNLCFKLKDLDIIDFQVDAKTFTVTVLKRRRQ